MEEKQQVTRSHPIPTVHLHNRKKVIYLAGAYRASSKAGVQANIQLARTTSARLWDLGYVVFSPHMNSGGLERYTNELNMMAGLLEFIRRVDIMVLLPNWTTSTGTKMEVLFAVQTGCKVMLLEDFIYGHLTTYQPFERACFKTQPRKSLKRAKAALQRLMRKS